MEASHPVPSASHPVWGRVVAAVAIAGVIALAVLIVHELMPRHASPHATNGAREEETPTVVPTSAPVAAPRQAPRPRAAAPTTATAAASRSSTAVAAAAPLAATVIAGVVANPEAFAPSHVFAPPMGNDQLYNYEPLPPFNSTTLKRLRTNPAAWELDAVRGPKMNDLGPEGAVHQAAIVKDSIGNETPWYSVDSGPLAPAYAVMQGTTVRVMSRAFLLQSSATLPPELAAMLGK